MRINLRTSVLGTLSVALITVGVVLLVVGPPDYRLPFALVLLSGDALALLVAAVARYRRA